MTEKHKQNMAAIVAAPEIEALFVQTAGGMAYHDGKLTLHDLAPTTLFFSDRPDRVTGHISSEEFVDSWDKGPDSFASNPPNAVLSVFHPDGVSDVVVEITEPEAVERAVEVYRHDPRRRDAGQRRPQLAVHRHHRAAVVTRVGGRGRPPRRTPTAIKKATDRTGSKAQERTAG